MTRPFYYCTFFFGLMERSNLRAMPPSANNRNRAVATASAFLMCANVDTLYVTYKIEWMSKAPVGRRSVSYQYPRYSTNETHIDVLSVFDRQVFISEGD